MNYATVSVAEFISNKDVVGVWSRSDDVPYELRHTTVPRPVQPDYFTPLVLGKEGLFAGARQHQPRTAKLLMEAGPLILRARGAHSMPADSIRESILDFGLEVHGQMVMIERSFYGYHPADSTFHQNKPGAELLRALPAFLREAYYTTFRGMKMPETAIISIYGRFLPRTTSNFALWDQYLGKFRGYKKQYIPWLMEKLPETRPKQPSKHGFFDFRCMLESVPDEKGVVDYLWVKSFCEDGTIYHIRGGDVENMRILAEPAEAIDLYCEHVLSRAEGSFNFLPFTEAMT